MASLSKQDQELDDFLIGLGISPKGRDILIEQGLDEGLLRGFPANMMKSELIVTTGHVSQQFKVPYGDIIKLTTWKKSIENQTRKESPKGSPNRTKKSNRSPSGTRKASPNKTRKAYANGSPLGSPPKPHEFYRQSSVSEDLLTELANDHPRRTLMDLLMSEIDVVYKDEHVLLHRHDPNGYFSDLKRGKKSIYYRWDIIREDHPVQAFHLSLNHTPNEQHENRTGFARNVVGALHVRMGVSNGPFRRIVINLIKGVYEITVCTENTKYIDDLDPIARKIIEKLAEYYNHTGRKATTVFDNRKGPVRKERRC